jgi:hypothetical protein
MAKLTNRLNLPQPIVDAVKNDSYSSGDADMSVTTLLKPPRVVALEKLYEFAIEEDASDRIWSLCGQVIHGILERADVSGIAERRLSIEVEGWKISGQMDRYEKAVLQDYKFVTAYKFKDAGVPEDYEAQLNIYAEILRSHGHPVLKAEIVGILRDWSRMEARRDESYPQTQIVVREVPLWSAERVQAFIRERVILHKQAQVELPLCVAKDRWAKPDTFAVTKQGAKRATRVYEDEDEALAHARQDSTLFVKKRLGENVRCANYCSVARFCTQFKTLEADTRSDWQKPLTLGQGKAG